MQSLSFLFFFFSSRRRHTRWPRDWSSDVCSSDLKIGFAPTLDEAIDLVFGGDSGAQAGDAEVTDPDGVAGTGDTETGEGTVAGDSQEGATEGERAEETPTGEDPAKDGAPQERRNKSRTHM